MVPTNPPNPLTWSNDAMPVESDDGSSNDGHPFEGGQRINFTGGTQLTFKGTFTLTVRFDPERQVPVAEFTNLAAESQISSKATHVVLKDPHKLRVVCQLTDWNDGTKLDVYVTVKRAGAELGTGRRNGVQASHSKAYDIDVSVNPEVSTSDLVDVEVTAYLAKP